MALTKKMASVSIQLGDKDQDGRVDIVAEVEVFGFLLIKPNVHNLDAASAFAALSQIRGLVGVFKRLIPGL